MKFPKYGQNNMIPFVSQPKGLIANEMNIQPSPKRGLFGKLFNIGDVGEVDYLYDPNSPNMNYTPPFKPFYAQDTEYGATPQQIAVNPNEYPLSFRDKINVMNLQQGYPTPNTLITENEFDPVQFTDKEEQAKQNMFNLSAYQPLGILPQPGQSSVPPVEPPAVEPPIDQNDTQKKPIDPVQAAILANAATIGASMVNNQLQTPPPKMQSFMPTMQRMQLDTTALDERKKDIVDTRSNMLKMLRTQTGQMSDLMRGALAVQSNTQKEQDKIAAAKQQAIAQNKAINTEIANKENLLRTEIKNKDLQVNQANAREFALRKSQALSDNLTQLNALIAGQAQYSKDLEFKEKQEELQRLSLETNLELQAGISKFITDKDYKTSQQYISGRQATFSKRALEAEKIAQEASGLQNASQTFVNDKLKQFKTDFANNQAEMRGLKIEDGQGGFIDSADQDKINRYNLLKQNNQNLQKDINQFEKYNTSFQSNFNPQELDIEYDRMYRQAYDIGTYESVEKTLQDFKEKLKKYK